MSKLDDLTIGEARQLAAMMNGGGQRGPNVFAGFIGRYCIVRASAAGVHAGVVMAVESADDGLMNVVLRDARRLWSWHAKSGVSLSGCATFGVERSKSKIETAIPEHAVAGVCELIPCTDVARESINGN